MKNKTLIFCLNLLLILSNATAINSRQTFIEAFRDILHNIQPLNEGPIPREVFGWGDSRDVLLGQVTAVSVNIRGQPIILHRGPRIWDTHSFNKSHYFQKLESGPINVDTVLVLSPETGSVLSSWGKNLFYLPHGLTVDSKNNVWITDIAMHQVLKFPASNYFVPTLRLGEMFQPGVKNGRLCKPTSVAVSARNNGQFFVADGYCNNRVLHFSRNGVILRILPTEPGNLPLSVPHSATLLEERDLLCVADRENMRIVCYKANLEDYKDGLRHRGEKEIFEILNPRIGKIFAIDSHDDTLLAINGYTSPRIPIKGFTIDAESNIVMNNWGPNHKNFENPHDIAVSPFGDAVYVTEIGPNRIWKFSFGINKM